MYDTLISLPNWRAKRSLELDLSHDAPSEVHALTSINGRFLNLKWQNLSTAPGDCIRQKRFVGRRLGSLQQLDFVWGCLHFVFPSPLSSLLPPDLKYRRIFDFEVAKSIYSAWRLHMSTEICWATPQFTASRGFCLTPTLSLQARTWHHYLLFATMVVALLTENSQGNQSPRNKWSVLWCRRCHQK